MERLIQKYFAESCRALIGDRVLLSGILSVIRALRGKREPGGGVCESCADSPLLNNQTMSRVEAQIATINNETFAMKKATGAFAGCLIFRRGFFPNP